MDAKLDLEYPLTTSTNSQHLNFDTSIFKIESQHMPQNTADNFDISSSHETISFILNLTHNFDRFVSYLAINYLHRFLSYHPIQEGKPWVLRLLAISCASLALKMRKIDFSLTDIQHEFGFIFDKQTIRRMELLILGALKWRMRSATPFSFINFFVSFFKLKDPPLLQALKARATEIIFKSQHEMKILEFKPSVVAASALLSASHELFPLQFPSFKKAISTCSYVNNVSLSKCNNIMQDVAMDGYESVLDIVSSSNTPVNVLDRQWSSSSSDSTDDGTIKVEVRDFKRRKVISSTFKSDETFQLSQIQQC